MPEKKIKRAIISVHDKTGIVDFARALVDEFGIEIISTGGTAALLKEHNIPVTLVEEVTGFPEMTDGRVKTLHPKIHAAILADRDNPEHMRQLKEQGVKPIDMVVVNLYPFEKTVADPNCTFEQAIEMIDIGGPCMLRAAAKNHKHVLVCSHSWEYGTVLEFLRNPSEADARRAGLLENATEAFRQTAFYDTRIHAWLTEQQTTTEAPNRVISLIHGRSLRYGENPHQTGFYYPVHSDPDFNRVAVQVGRSETEVSFNNYNDASAAFDLCRDVSQRLTGRAGDSNGTSVVTFIKHTNACGVAVDSDPVEAYRKAYLGDPNAAMGGILAVNFEVDAAFAEAVMNTYQRWGKDAGAGGFFVEVWLAPSFEDNAPDVIRTRKSWGQRVRLLAVGDMDRPVDEVEMDVKKIAGGMLAQDRDIVGLNEDQWKVVSKRRSSDSEMADLRLAWLICKHTKSNAITVCRDNMLIGNGAGQMSRVMSCRIATWLARENGHAEKLPGAVAASDAFFPFRDGPDILMDAGVTAVIQPGGSKRDADTIAACDERDVAMIFTGTRHFKH